MCVYVCVCVHACLKFPQDVKQLDREMCCGLSSSSLPPLFFFPFFLENVIPDLWV